MVRERAAAIDPSGILLAAVHHWANRAKLELTRSLREHSLLIAAVGVFGRHYAIDGYVAIPLTRLIWRTVGWLLGRPPVTALLGYSENSPAPDTTRSEPAVSLR